MGMETYQRDSALRAIEEMYAEVEKLRTENAKLRTPFGAIQETTPLKCSKWPYDLVKSEAGWLRIESEYAEDVETAKRNDEINAANQTLVSNLRKVIASAGFPETRSEWKRNKLVRVPNEWSNCINVANTNGTNVLEAGMKAARERRESFLKEKEQERIKREREIADRDAKRRADITFVELCRDLVMDATTASADEIEENILGMCKYLRLAVAGMDTRNDWSDGCHRVEIALAKFDIESPRDQEIFDDWRGHCESFEDGRQFRDCLWNYDRLFDLADISAVALWTKFQSIREVHS